MHYTIIDRSAWDREEYFAHYLHAVPCTYSLTTKIDITRLRQSGHKLYPAMLYFLTKTVNQFPQFRMAFRPDGTLVCYDGMSPCYTVFHPETETFSNLWTAYTDDYTAFCRRYQADLAQYGAVTRMTAKPDAPENCFTVSMLPWTSFDGFNLNVNSYDYLIPIFTLGKFEETPEGVRLPLAVQVHHAVCDGYHVARFLETLQEFIRSADLS